MTTESEALRYGQTEVECGVDWLSLLQIRPGVTAVIGSGGKTTLLRTLGAQLCRWGTVILCTTTHIRPFGDLTCLPSPTEEELFYALQTHRLLCVGTPEPETGKLTAPDIPVGRLRLLADFILVEADGAAGRPLKAHAPHEPVIPPSANQTICVVGLAGLGRPIAEAAHRPERYAALAGAAPEDTATPERAARVLRRENLADRYLFNQADTPERAELGEQMAERLGLPAALSVLREGRIWKC